MLEKCKTFVGLAAVGVLALPLTAQAMARPEKILRTDQPLTGLDAPAGQSLTFRIWVLAGSRELRLRTSGGGGDLDLYLRHGAPPTPHAFDDRSRGGGTDKLVGVARPAEGWWYVTLTARRRFRDVTLLAHVEAPPPRRPPRAGHGAGEILAPTDGESWHAGQTHAIRWRTRGPVRNVRIELSLDDGRTWQRGRLPESIAVRAGEHEVRLRLQRPSLTAAARIRILDADRGRVLDISGRFRIFPGRDHDDDGDDPPLHHRGRDRYENDNKRDRASSISAHERQTRTIYPDEDEDWVRFVPARGGRYLLRVGPSTTPLKAEVWIGRYDGKEKRVEKVKFSRAGGSVLLEADREVRYYKLKIEAQDDDDTGVYRLSVVPVR